jgi:hypothetical protein
MVIKEAVEMTRRGQMFWNVRWPFLSITDSIDWLDIYVRNKKDARFTFALPSNKTIDISIFAPPHVLGE